MSLPEFTFNDIILVTWIHHSGSSDTTEVGKFNFNQGFFFLCAFFFFFAFSLLFLFPFSFLPPSSLPPFLFWASVVQLAGCSTVHTSANFFFLAAWPNLWDLISPTKDRTHAPYSGRVESWPLDGQGIPSVNLTTLKNPLTHLHIRILI